MNLNDILTYIEINEDSGEPIKLDDLKYKIDAYHDIFSGWDAQIGLHAHKIEELQKAKKILENKKARLKEYVLFTMKAHEFKKLPGVNYQASLVKKKIKVFGKKAPPDRHWCDRYPDWVRITREWDKKAVKAAAESGNHVAESFIEEKESEYVQFRAKT